MNALVESGEFANRADQITAALRFWFAYRRFDVKMAVREFLSTEEGRRLLRDTMKRRPEKEL